MSEADKGLDKILELDELMTVLDRLRQEGKRIVHCHGVFDLLHIGHIRHLESARRFGDLLVVTVTPNQWVNKGPHRPAFDEQLRAEALASLAAVDYVAVNRWPTAVETIKTLAPDFFVKGSEFADLSSDVTGAVEQEAEAVKSVGGQIVFTDDITYSSSSLINRFMPALTKQAASFMEDLSQRHSADDVLGYLNGARNLRVLTVGETIVDEYRYCETLGAAGKEPILAVRLESTETFAGGTLAVANHVASFCDNVTLASYLGEQDSQEQFIRENLNPRVNAQFIHVPNAPTIVKRRYIESYPFQKMFEVYVMSDERPDTTTNRRLCDKLAELVPQHDLVLVTDYGHGMLGADAIDILASKSRCLAVNTQANAGNQGYNTISKYPRADFICVSEKEIRLETREQRRELRQIVQRVAKRLEAERILITQGAEGMLHYSQKEGFLAAPALIDRFTDRVGAGDAVLAVSSLCVVQDAPAEIVALIASAVGAMAVEIVGNRAPIDNTQLTRFIIALFK